MNNLELQQLVLESLGGCSWEFDLPTDQIIYSDDFFKLLGYRPDEITINPDWVRNNIHPEDLSQWNEAFVKSIKGDSKYFDCELRFKHKDNYYIWIQTRGVVTARDESGRAVHVAGIVFDIGERKPAKEVEARFRLFLDNIPVALSLKDQAGRYLYINRQFETWLGKPSYQIYGQTADEIFQSSYDELSGQREHERQVWESGETVSMEREFPRTDDGQSRHALIVKFPVFDEAGQILAIGTTNTDLSERYRAQEAVIMSEQRYRNLFDLAPAVLVESDWTIGKALIDKLREQGVDDIKQHLIDHPELLRYRGQIMKVLRVNQEALRVYRSASAESLIGHIEGEMNDVQRLGMIEDLATFASGQRRSFARCRTFREDGEEFSMIAESELNSDDPEDWSQILLTVRDTSAEEVVRMSEVRFRRLFESAPVALYESDWSKGKQLIDQLLEQGVEDICQHLVDNPQLIKRRDDVHIILNANEDAISMYRSRDKESHIRFVEGELINDQRLALIEVLDSFASGRRRSIYRTNTVRENGEIFPIIRNCELISRDRQDWSLVLISIQDMSFEVEAARRLEVYQQELRSLSGKISLAEESERRRISSELHDGTIQNLVLARIHLANLRNSLETEATLGLADSINELLDNSLQETRSLIFEISPPVLYELGLESAVEWLAERYQQRTGVDVNITSDEVDTRLPEEMNIVLFQTARELLVNIAKHAQAQSVSVNWEHKDDCVVLSVQDDGVGFDVTSPPTRLASEGGFGLFAVRERLNLLGAEIDFQSSGQGTRVTITAPV